MKKIFTLIVLACLSSASFAQDKFVDRVINGDCEGDDASCFWTHEYRDGERVEGICRLVADPTDPNNHVAIVSSRDQEEGEALEDWDSQFFVYVQEKLNVNDEYRLTMRIRADKPADCSTQAHNTPGDYNHWNMIGNIQFTTEWQTIVKEGIVTSQQVYGDEGPDVNTDWEMHTIAFNLYLLKEANNYYFDDIKLEVRGAKAPTPFEGWFNMVKNSDLSTDDVSSFTGRDGIDGVDRPARIVVDADGKRALNVTAIDPAIDEETGEPQSMTDWQTQFFVTIPHAFRAGEKYHFSMKARAAKECEIDTQAHITPGDYKHYEMLGRIALTPEWQEFEYEGEINSNQATSRTIAFNLQVLKEANEYYFRDIEFSVNAADIADSERTLGEEAVSMPVPDKDGEARVTIDMTACMEQLGVTDFKDLITGSNMKIITDDGTFSKDALSPVNDGASINADGILDPDGDITFEIDDSSTDNQATFVISNFGERLAAGQAIATRICFQHAGWFYVYNVTFTDQENFDGIRTVTAQPTKGLIYDLSGRQVARPTNGIFILDGKKFIKK